MLDCWDTPNELCIRAYNLVDFQYSCFGMYKMDHFRKIDKWNKAHKAMVCTGFQALLEQVSLQLNKRRRVEINRRFLKSMFAVEVLKKLINKCFFFQFMTCRVKPILVNTIKVRSTIFILIMSKIQIQSI